MPIFGAMSALLDTSEVGLFCADGGFAVDPWRPRAGVRAIITHAHSDHASAGADEYLTSPSGEHVLRARLGPGAKITAIPWGLAGAVRLGDVRVSLHPAGHVLGSAQVRVERIGGSAGPKGETWVVSGDYKVADDGVSEAFEPVRCDTFITESTFGLPIYRWRSNEELMREVSAWWHHNAANGCLSVLLAYSLGKTQRLMAGLARAGLAGPILLHGAAVELTAAYARAGAVLPAFEHATKASAKAAGSKALVIGPASIAGSAWLRGIERASGADDLAIASASGWMQLRGVRRRAGLARGFVISDHADWPGLMGTIRQTGAERVGVTHGFVSPMVRHLRETGVDAFAVATRYVGEAPGAAAEDGEADGEAGGDASGGSGAERDA